MPPRIYKHSLLILVYLAVPLLFVGAEVGLRLWAPGLASRLVHEVTFDGREWYELNRAYLKKYFPPGNPLVPEFKPALLQRVKSPDMFRVICLGSSTMFGTPYQMTSNIPGILRKQLRHAYPGRDIEVVNIGASAINSNVILDLSEDLGSLEPDLVLIYMGHNEFYGPEGVGAGFLEKNIPGFISFKYALRDLRVTTALLNLIPAGKRSEVERNLMLEVSRRGIVRPGSVDASRVFDLFASNLESIIAFWKSRHVPLIISDISSNLMFAPFLGDTLASPPLRSLGELVKELEQGRVDECLNELLLWRDHDSTNALVEYWIGRSLLMKHDTTGARQHLLSARDLDLLKFRAPERINMIIREAALRSTVPIVSTDSAFSGISPGGIPGDDLFWEHLHPTVRGYYEISGLFYKRIQELGLLSNGSPDLSPQISFDADSLSLCWLDLAYGDLSIQHLTGRWPFTHYRREQVAFPKGPVVLQNIARAVYERRVSWDQGCYESASQFWRLGDTRSAATTYEALVEEYPSGYYPLYLLGNLRAKMGDVQEALRHLEASIVSNPGYINARLDLGLLQINAGRFDEAITQFTSAIGLRKATTSPLLIANARYGLAAAYANKSDYEQALLHVEESLRIMPKYAEALALKEGILQARPR